MMLRWTIAVPVAEDLAGDFVSLKGQDRTWKVNHLAAEVGESI